MKKKTILLLCLGLGIVVLIVWVLFFKPSKTSLSSPVTSLEDQAEPIIPSETVIAYEDPSGFSFNYPDNLTLTKQDEVDENTYADIQLTAKGVNGNLSLKIVDSKFKSITQWAELNKGVSKEIMLGKLNALEIKTNDRLLLGALDQGILFTIEMPLIEEDFWTLVYDKVITDFSFAKPAIDNTSSGGASSADDVSFEGEEVVE